MPVGNQCRFSATEVLSFTTMNMINSNHIITGKHFQKLLTELFCQKNTRSNNYSGSTTKMLMLQVILNHTNGFATARGDDDLTLVVLLHRFQCFLLVWAKGDQVVSCSVWIYYSRKRSPKEPPVPVKKLVLIHTFVWVLKGSSKKTLKPQLVPRKNNHM